MDSQKKVVIVGGGFGGVGTALSLARRKLPSVKIVLISDIPHFEYHPSLYRVVTGKSPLEVCIPLSEIFKNTNVEVVEDSITHLDTNGRVLKGASESRYSYDFLVLALGSEAAYYNITGLKENTFGFKTIKEALVLKRHLHEVFTKCKDAPKDQKTTLVHIVIIGGGAAGTELAGELAVYAKGMAASHRIDPSLVTIDLFEAASRLLPTLPEDVSKKVHVRLQGLGVNIFLNRAVEKEELENVYLKDMHVKAKTVIWTAGVKPNSFYSTISSFELDKKGRVVVDEYLRAKNLDNVFVVGDAASTENSGTAQTAVLDGLSVVENINRQLHGESLTKAISKKSIFAVPVGPSWAAVPIGNLRFYGRLGWFIRKVADLKYLLSILPLREAFLAFQSGKTLCESCPVCSETV